MFSATGVTQGTFLDGVRFFPGGATSHSIVMRSETGTIRYIKTEHHFEEGKKWA
jgi:fructose-1,6-bisphosphatase/sedoheptulose 1,7-bisphosphatase-like protein